MKSMILAAGYGERLWPLTADRGKPALPVLGKPLVGYVAEYLAQNGVTESVVNLHHRPETVRASLGDGSKFGLHLEYVYEPVILGTSGGLDNAREFFQDGTFICVNGKIITDIDLHAAIETHRKQKALATLVLKRNKRRERFSMVEAADGLVTRFAGMPQPAAEDDAEAPLMFTGIHILEPRIFDYIPRDVFSDSVVHVYPQAMAKGERIAAYVGEGKWHELSTLQRYLGISLDLLAAQDRNAFSGDRTQVAPKAKIRDAILWNDVEVENGASVTRSVIGDGVSVRAHEAFEDSIVVRAELVHDTMAPPKALKGSFQDDKFVVPLSQ
ncbi:MAG TPA: NDP-sugar synthase [Pyrinomonadaceae bacterium]|nr:NDP-sugar synthase [Pyrinomonadaceae bacterium]